MSDTNHPKTSASSQRPPWMAHLLDRDPIPPLDDLLRQSTTGRTILITGAGGSIGRELGRQLVPYEPRALILLDRCRQTLDESAHELEGQAAKISTIVGSAGDQPTLDRAFTAHPVDIVYHAAADKHVPLVEATPIEGLTNNTLGTRTIARSSAKAGVHAFVLISTDKAVRPAGVMGASKRMAELAVHSISLDRGNTHDTAFAIVRFGNVLGSSGSVVPIFHKQILAGAPLTLTHAEATRFFMTPEEAAQLVIQAGAMARGGETFVLDMGEPVRILDLARRMLLLSRGDQCDDTPGEIASVGLRPGEKMHEELCIDGITSATSHPRIMQTIETTPPRQQIDGWLDELEHACNTCNVDAAYRVLACAVEDYHAPQDPMGAVITEER